MNIRERRGWHQIRSVRMIAGENRTVSRGYPLRLTRITIRLNLIGSATRHHAGAPKVVINISIMAEVTFRVSGNV